MNLDSLCTLDTMSKSNYFKFNLLIRIVGPAICAFGLVLYFTNYWIYTFIQDIVTTYLPWIRYSGLHQCFRYAAIIYILDVIVAMWRYRTVSLNLPSTTKALLMIVIVTIITVSGKISDHLYARRVYNRIQHHDKKNHLEKQHRVNTRANRH